MKVCVCIIMFCFYTCKYCVWVFSHFCSYFISFVLLVRPCFPSRCPWKGEIPELMPESLSQFFGKTRFPTCAMCSTCSAQAGDLSQGFYPARVCVALWGFDSILPCSWCGCFKFSSLVVRRKQPGSCFQAGFCRNTQCVFRCLSDIWASLGDWRSP